MSDVFCKQCGVTDDQQAKCDDGCGVFCQECEHRSTLVLSGFGVELHSGHLSRQTRFL
jgi:hypothetical protein